MEIPKHRSLEKQQRSSDKVVWFHGSAVASSKNHALQFACSRVAIYDTKLPDGFLLMSDPHMPSMVHACACFGARIYSRKSNDFFYKCLEIKCGGLDAKRRFGALILRRP